MRLASSAVIAFLDLRLLKCLVSLSAFLPPNVLAEATLVPALCKYCSRTTPKSFSLNLSGICSHILLRYFSKSFLSCPVLGVPSSLSKSLRYLESGIVVSLPSIISLAICSISAFVVCLSASVISTPASTCDAIVALYSASINPCLSCSTALLLTGLYR